MLGLQKCEEILAPDTVFFLFGNLRTVKKAVKFIYEPEKVPSLLRITISQSSAIIFPSPTVLLKKTVICVLEEAQANFSEK